MEVSKFVHSCLFIKSEGKKFLIDPGNYSYEAIDHEELDGLDYLLITHEHPDHMYLPFIKELVKRFANLSIISNTSVCSILKNEGITATSLGTDFISLEQVPHEKVFGTEPPENVLFRVSDYLTHPGDSLHFSSTTPVLALPVQAPWGSLTQAVELAVSLKPKVVLPIHDWHWNDKARGMFYKRLESYFANNGIRFIALKTGEQVSI